MKASERVAFLKQFTVLHTSRWGQRGDRRGVHICPKICTYYVDVISAVCFILNSTGLSLESFNSFSLRPAAAVCLPLPDLKVTGLRFMAGICCESLSSVYLRMQRFELPP